ncbi:MAG: motility associated factor glycosyltransferase family protein [Oceanospirillaceae bacterium]|nr:motility associated factor glycosyltransferase family protein [Oceanospirillaceae bacterium]
MSNNPPFIQAALDRFDKNMAFMEKHLPNLYKVLNSWEMKKTRLEIDHENEEYKLFAADMDLYPAGAQAYAIEEAEEFLSQVAPGAPLISCAPSTPGLYEIPRFFARHLDQTIRQAFPSSGFKHYPIPDFYPMIVFMGVGLGLHIQEVLKNSKIQTLVIFENDPEQFLASMYVTDWYEIIPNFKINNGMAIHFVIMHDTDEDASFKQLWNELNFFVPHFPLATLFYNHRKVNFYQRILNRIHKDFSVFLGSWGNYDDEVNQMNNALYNLKEKIPVARPINLDGAVNVSGMPIVVVGAGPSLNGYIDFLKEYQDEIVILCSGTAISILHHHDIKPDIQVEIESDYCVTAALENLNDDEYLKSIPIIGPIQLNPIAFSKFNKKYLYFKDSTALGGMFAHKDEIFLGTTPTCTNAASSIALSYGFKNIFLIGLDYGYRSKSETHAKGSIWYDKDKPKELNRSMEIKNREKPMEVEAVGGGKILTEQIYYSSKRRLEALLEPFKSKNVNVYNLSNGARIEGTIEIQEDEMVSIIQENEIKKDVVLAYLLPRNPRFITEEEIQKGLSSIQDYIQSICEFNIALIEKIDFTFESLSRCLLILNQRMNLHYNSDINRSYYFYTRGMIWHYIFAGYSMAMFNRDKQDEARVIRDWQSGFIDFLKKLPGHLHYVINKERTDMNHDDWLRQSILDPVSEPDLMRDI